MEYKALNITEKFSKFDELWSPKVIAEMNNNQFKLVKVYGEFVWHDHPDTDEVFFIIEGELDILFRDGTVSLKSGEMFIVPKGKKHKPVAKMECRMMLIEPKGVVNTGDSGGDLKAENDVWI